MSEEQVVYTPEIAPTPAPTPDPVPADLGDAGKRALASERQQRQELQQQLKKFEGVDPDEYFRVRQELELERGYADQKLSESQQQLDSLQREIRERDVQSVFYSSVSDRVVDSTSADLLYSYISQNYPISVEDGELSLWAGDRAIPLSEAMPKIVEQIPYLFKAPNRSNGAGIRQTQSGSALPAGLPSGMRIGKSSLAG